MTRRTALAWGLWLWCVPGLAAAQAPDSKDPTDWTAVISKLRQDLYQRPGHAQTRRQLAIAYNNYAVELGNGGQWEQGIEPLQEALRLDPENQQFRQNLSRLHLHRAYQAFERHLLLDAKAAIQETITLNPTLTEAYILLGEIEYNNQKLKEAKTAWQRALELDPSRTELANRLKQVTDELPVESKFERLSQAYFDLRYEEKLERPVGFDIRDALLQARRDVGSDFAYWPKHKIVVLVYSGASFRTLRQETPDWVGGQFDGKIRVPLPNGHLDQATVKQILFHEYTHALIHDLAGEQCPTWLNEGLAEYEGRKQQTAPPIYLTKAYQAGRLIPWAQLSDQFSMSLPAEEVALGYQESHSIVTYFVERYGFWRIRRVLKALAEGKSWDAVLAEEFHLKLVRLETMWGEWLPQFLNTTSGFAPRRGARQVVG